MDTVSNDPETPVPALMTVHRPVPTAYRPESVECAGCGAAVPVGRRGPLPTWCGQTCRQRSWERRRAVAELAATGAGVAVRDVVPVPVAVRPERSEWVGELAELTRQVATRELPDGCLHPVYEALTVVINQIVHRHRSTPGGRTYSFEPHPALVGREQIIADQLDTDGLDSQTVRRRFDAACELSRRRYDARIKRRFQPRS